MADSKIQELEKIINEASSDLPKVTGKKMFGCHALWANGNVFALVWKKGRIGLKFTDEGQFKSIMKLDGSVPWKAGPMTMSHWVLVPDSLHKKPQILKGWVQKAHALALVAPPKAKKKKTK